MKKIIIVCMLFLLQINVVKAETGETKEQWGLMLLNVTDTVAESFRDSNLPEEKRLEKDCNAGLQASCIKLQNYYQKQNKPQRVDVHVW